MSLIPIEELKKQGAINFAPLVDFLFLVLAVFATLAVTRTALYDTDIKLARAESRASASTATGQKMYFVNLTISDTGEYKWISETSEYLMDGVVSIAQEIKRQQRSGLLPRDNEQTKVLLHIDKGAPWEAIAPLILTLKEIGFGVHPVYKVAS